MATFKDAMVVIKMASVVVSLKIFTQSFREELEQKMDELQKAIAEEGLAEDASHLKQKAEAAYNELRRLLTDKSIDPDALKPS